MPQRLVVLLVAVALAIWHPAVALDLPSNATMIIRGYGYPCEDHTTQTSDGWVLSLQHIPYGKNQNPPTKGVVLYQHGLLASSVGVVLNVPFEDLPLILADAGYDVWLGNNRGNGYSMTNIYYTPDQDEFWDFTWDEMALYDLPALVEYVLKTTGVSQLLYVGHSEGVTQVLAGLIVNHTLADYFKAVVGMAPAAYVAHTTSALVRALAEIDTPMLLELLGVREFSLPRAVQLFLPNVCNEDPKLCTWLVQLVQGEDYNLNTSRLYYYSNYEPSPTSTKNMAHWAQGVTKKTFSMYDYGVLGNVVHYGQPTAPAYNLTDFPAKVPLAFFCGGKDEFADPEDVQTLLSLLPAPPIMVQYYANYTHLDFTISDTAWQNLYPTIVSVLEKFV